jgi:uncharacterized protein
MPRPRRCRRIRHKPNINYFKPAGVPLSVLEEITISFEELESIRLKDTLNFDQNTCAIQMNVSQPTFHRLLLDARKKIGLALVKGLAIRIEGGDFIYKK